jgi:ABC-2 type transport system ATP-binding protein
MKVAIQNLRKIYSGEEVLNIPELTINGGEVTGIVGNNGAGKTTLLRAMLDLIPLDQGTISIDQEQVSTGENWKSNTKAFLGSDAMIKFLTPLEYFYFTGTLSGKSEEEVDRFLKDYEAFFNDEILGKGKKLIRDFSAGNIQKVGIVSALIADPGILILDEPFNFLDPTSQLLLQDIILEVGRKISCTVIISSHDINQLAGICDRAILLEKGIVKKDITEAETILTELTNYFTPVKKS